VYRGDYCITNIPNRPGRDLPGERLASMYRKRQLFVLIQHRSAVGCGYYFTVTVNSTSYTAFKTLQELHHWLNAYGLKVVDERKQEMITISTIVPNAAFKSWQPLQSSITPMTLVHSPDPIFTGCT